MLIFEAWWQGGLFMTMKRMVATMAILLIMIGAAVSASESLKAIAEEHTTSPIVCEVTKPDETIKPIPTASVGKIELLTAAVYFAETTTGVSDNLEPTEDLKLTGVVVENATDAAEVVKATETTVEVEETKPEPEAKPLAEGTIIDPDMDESEIVLEEYVWEGEVINSYNGTVAGPNGKETYYNLNMSGVVRIMESLGYDYEYWVREDGAKMYGPFIMVAADLDLRPRGSIIKTSLGWAMVCDTGEFTNWNPTQLDIAVAW